ncbi:MAG: type II toxin-antitoxin system VapC family toxin [Bacteroidota bacterium]|nr:type II toxin-antitoxin system VapC family toxin [Bacteroidota bacterium]
MNRALIDTDILSFYFKGDPVVIRNFEKYLINFNIIEISIITYYEITSGLVYRNALKQLELFRQFITENIVVPLTENSCKISSEIYSELRLKGELIDDIDLLIAGIAIENDMTLVTNNANHFSRIPELKIENWKTDLAQ